MSLDFDKICIFGMSRHHTLPLCIWFPRAPVVLTLNLVKARSVGGKETVSMGKGNSIVGGKGHTTGRKKIHAVCYRHSLECVNAYSLHFLYV